MIGISCQVIRDIAGYLRKSMLMFLQKRQYTFIISLSAKMACSCRRACGWLFTNKVRWQTVDCQNSDNQACSLDPNCQYIRLHICNRAWRYSPWSWWKTIHSLINSSITYLVCYDQCPLTFFKPFQESTLCTFLMSSWPVLTVNRPVLELLNCERKTQTTKWYLEPARTSKDQQVINNVCFTDCVLCPHLTHLFQNPSHQVGPQRMQQKT